MDKRPQTAETVVPTSDGDVDAAALPPAALTPVPAAVALVDDLDGAEPRPRVTGRHLLVVADQPEPSERVQTFTAERHRLVFKELGSAGADVET